MRVKLGDVATYINGYTFKPSDWSDTGVPIIRIQDLTGNSYQANRYNGTYDKKYEVLPGDVLISWSASLGVYVWDGEPSVLNQHIFKVVFNKCPVDKSFFVHQVRSILIRAASAAHGATMKHLTKPVFDALPFYLPRLEEQRRIAAVLDKVTDLIAKRQAQLDKLDELVKSRFVEMFGDPVRNEKNWPMVEIGDIAEIRIGPFGSLLHKEDYISGGHALVNPSHIIDGQIYIDNNLTVSSKKYKILEPYHLKVNDIVLGRRGEMGRCAVVKEEGLLCGTGSLIIRTKGEMEPYFLQSIISNPAYKKIIEDKAVGVTMMNLNVSIVSNLTVPKPPMSLQRNFISTIRESAEIKQLIITSLKKHELFKSRLMQTFFM